MITESQDLPKWAGGFGQFRVHLSDRTGPIESVLKGTTKTRVTNKLETETEPQALPEVNERCDGSQETLVVKVHTDAGIVGVGEVDSSSLVAKAIIEAPLSHKICRGLAECVLGEDPFEIDRLVLEGHVVAGATLPRVHVAGTRRRLRDALPLIDSVIDV